jgi:hypothetical protein
MPVLPNTTLAEALARFEQWKREQFWQCRAITHALMDGLTGVDPAGVDRKRALKAGEQLAAIMEIVRQ